MSNDNTKILLEKLHDNVAKELLDRLLSGEATTDIEENKPMMNLVKALPFTEAKEA